MAKQVAQEVRPTALQGAALEHTIDRCRQSQEASEISGRVPSRTLLERAEELPPEALGLAVAQGNADRFAVADGVDANRHHDGP